MSKKRLRALIPKPETLQKNRWLALFGQRLLAPQLWYLHRRSVAKASSIGFFVAYLPIPGHMFLAALAAIVLRANLPLSIALVWIVNPITLIPLFGFAYTLGAYILDVPLTSFHFEWALFRDIWAPLLVGSLLCGTFLATAGNLAIRFYWRYAVRKAWKNRSLQRKIRTFTEEEIA